MEVDQEQQNPESDGDSADAESSNVETIEGESADVESIESESAESESAEGESAEGDSSDDDSETSEASSTSSTTLIPPRTIGYLKEREVKAALALDAGQHKKTINEVLEVRNVLRIRSKFYGKNLPEAASLADRLSRDDVFKKACRMATTRLEHPNYDVWKALSMSRMELSEKRVFDPPLRSLRKVNPEHFISVENVPGKLGQPPRKRIGKRMMILLNKRHAKTTKPTNTANLPPPLDRHHCHLNAKLISLLKMAKDRLWGPYETITQNAKGDFKVLADLIWSTRGIWTEECEQVRLRIITEWSARVTQKFGNDRALAWSYLFGSQTVLADFLACDNCSLVSNAADTMNYDLNDFLVAAHSRICDQLYICPTPKCASEEGQFHHRTICVPQSIVILALKDTHISKQIQCALDVVPERLKFGEFWYRRYLANIIKIYNDSQRSAHQCIMYSKDGVLYELDDNEPTRWKRRFLKERNVLGYMPSMIYFVNETLL